MASPRKSGHGLRALRGPEYTKPGIISDTPELWQVQPAAHRATAALPREDEGETVSCGRTFSSTSFRKPALTSLLHERGACQGSQSTWTHCPTSTLLT